METRAIANLLLALGAKKPYGPRAASKRSPFESGSRQTPIAVGPRWCQEFFCRSGGIVQERGQLTMASDQTINTIAKALGESDDGPVAQSRLSSITSASRRASPYSRRPRR